MGLACTRPDINNVIDFPQKVLLLGKSGAGKTSMLYGWKLGCDSVIKPIPTDDFNVEKIEHKGQIYIVWDLSGAPYYHPRWRQFYHGTNVLVIVVDSSDKDVMRSLREDVTSILQERDLDDIPCVLILNKSDITDEKPEAMEKTIDFPSSSNLHVISCCAKDDKSCKAALEKISDVCRNSKRPEL
ncbi:uncharacterized protein LOC143069614 [Mytilus galloprovincialis]|uniref:uncharacterized protein LOC143069614 n=1 Tax=Mytilus galloprovincialis TaxID=29158 RepID=UPI003F7CCA6F